jgi:5,10-methylenetetrahydromethanopterin reductase
VAGCWQAILRTTLTGTAHDIARRIRDYAAQGITEIIYQPTGPDIPGELEAFYTAARSATPARDQAG